MINFGSLPHVYADGRVETFGLCNPILVGCTAHTIECKHKRMCYCCRKEFTVLATKPGSEFVWCLECFSKV